MEYELLKTLYYKDRTSYENEYAKRFQDPRTIHLDLTIGDHPAFICCIPELFEKIVSIERTDKKVEVLCERLPGIATIHFAKRCLIDEIVLSNSIESVHSTRREITEILENLIPKTKISRFYGLVKKYERLMLDENISICTKEDIRKIYDDIFYDEIKKEDPENLPDGDIFRKGPNVVLSETQKEIHRGLYPESKIIAAMDQSLQFLNDEKIEMLFRTSVFHYLFGYIHPFYDGNGRTSRFISSYLLSKQLNRLLGFRISYTIKKNLTKYYEAFKICNHPLNKGDLTPFIEMFLDIIDISDRQLYDALLDRSKKLTFYADCISDLPNTSEKKMKDLYILLIQAALFSDNGITINELRTLLSISMTTLNTKLSLIPDNLLIKNRVERQVYYMLNLNEVDKMA